MGGQSQSQLTWKSHKTSHGNEKSADTNKIKDKEYLYLSVDCQYRGLWGLR